MVLFIKLDTPLRNNNLDDTSNNNNLPREGSTDTAQSFNLFINPDSTGDDDTSS